MSRLRKKISASNKMLTITLKEVKNEVHFVRAAGILTQN